MKLTSSISIATLIVLAALASACSPGLAAPTRDTAALQPVPVQPVTRVGPSASISINVGGENGTIPCDWPSVPQCGGGYFASCVQHGTGTGQPGPIARWEWSEWQCFPESFLPRH